MSMVGDIGAGLAGRAQLDAFMAQGQRPGIGDALDFDPVEVGDGLAVFTGEPGPHTFNPMGMAHGGWFATLLDSACGCAVHSKLTAEQAYTTLELKVGFHKALTAQSGRVRAEGRVLSIGRRVAFAKARLVDAAGKLHASATSTLVVMQK